MTAPHYSGIWTTEAPLGQAQLMADKAVLSQIEIPDEAVLVRMQIYIDGHLWRYESVRVRVKS